MNTFSATSSYNENIFHNIFIQRIHSLQGVLMENHGTCVNLSSAPISWFFFFLSMVCTSRHWRLTCSACNFTSLLPGKCVFINYMLYCPFLKAKWEESCILEVRRDYIYFGKLLQKKFSILVQSPKYQNCHDCSTHLNDELVRSYGLAAVR